MFIRIHNRSTGSKVELNSKTVKHKTGRTLIKFPKPSTPTASTTSTVNQTTEVQVHTQVREENSDYEDDGNLQITSQNVFQPNSPFKQRDNLIDDDGAYADVIRSWLTPKQATNLYHMIMEKATFVRRKRRSQYQDEKIITDDRLTFRCFDPDILPKLDSLSSYYSTHLEDDSNEHQDESELAGNWFPELDSIRNYLNQYFELKINSCLINCYQDGRDAIGYHSDKEVKEPLYMVITLSLGQSRDFYLKPNDKNRGETIKTTLHSGDLCLMYGRTQELYKHTVPKRTGRNNVGINTRFSVTFREL